MAINGHADAKDPRIGCLLISSPQGHSGKTVVSLGLCSVLRRRGFSVQPFKKGPDYIDPSWLTAAAGRSCRNLDFFLIPKNKLLTSFQQACQEADISIIEGAMGLYDGLGFVEYGTTAQIARLLNIPIILVVNTTRMTNSIAAIVTGYQHFQPDINIAGVILNNVSGIRHEGKLKTAVEQYCGIPVVGSIPRDSDLNISERHLGLIPFPESKESEAAIERICLKLESHLDLDNILTIARNCKINNFPYPPLLKGGLAQPTSISGQTRIAKIGILRDRVFNFYYPENLEALVSEGAQIIFINSFKDRLPELDGLYIGGGFPEFFLKELEGNHGLRKDIAEAVEKGLPVYAECAGLMYLCKSINWQGRSSEMVGAIPTEVRVSEKPEGHGYAVVEVVDENPFFPMGLNLRGHEFHHSKISHPQGLKFAYQVKRGQGIHGLRDGIVYKNLFASYIHLHALGTPEWAHGFMSLATRWKRSKGKVNFLEDGSCAG